MSFLNYLTTNWSLLLVFVLIIVVLSTTVQFSKRAFTMLLIACGLLLALSVVDYIETYLASLPEFNIWRAILSAIKYAIPPFILCQVGMLILAKFKIQYRLLIFVPAIIHLILCLVSISTGIIFFFHTDSNAFARGPLGYLPFIVSGLYIAFLLAMIIKEGLKNRDDIIPVAVLVVFVVLATVLPFIWGNEFQPLFCTTVAIGLLTYCIFLLQQLSKRDPLTNLLNRQSFYRDSEIYEPRVRVVISIDMNGLKAINDAQGHVAGDNALVDLANCLNKASTKHERIYRIGGDEFIILSTNENINEVKGVIERIRFLTSSSHISVAIGYGYRDKGSSITFDNIYKLADKTMYSDKNSYYDNLNNQ